MTDKKKCLIYSNKIGSRKRKSLFPWFRRQNTKSAGRWDTDATQHGNWRWPHTSDRRHTIYCPIFPARFNHEPCCISQSRRTPVVLITTTDTQPEQLTALSWVEFGELLSNSYKSTDLAYVLCSFLTTLSWDFIHQGICESGGKTPQHLSTCRQWDKVKGHASSHVIL